MQQPPFLGQKCHIIVKAKKILHEPYFIPLKFSYYLHIIHRQYYEDIVLLFFNQKFDYHFRKEKEINTNYTIKKKQNLNGLPWWLDDKELYAIWETQVWPLHWKDPLEKVMAILSLQYSLPGEFYGQRSLVSYSPWGHKESDMTEQLTHKYTKFNYNKKWFSKWTR